MCETQKYKSYFILAIQNTGQMWLTTQMESCGTSSKKIQHRREQGAILLPQVLRELDIGATLVDYPYL